MAFRIHNIWVRGVAASVLVLIPATTVFAQYTITTLAVSTASVGIGLQNGIAADGSGNVYVPGSAPESVVLKVNSSGSSVVVGSTQPNAPFPGCGMAATTIGMTDLGGVAFDTSGNLYVAQSGNGPVLLVSGGIASCLDGGKYIGAVGIATDNMGDVWISLGINGNVVYKLPASGGQVTVAGTLNTFGCTGGLLSDPQGLAVDTGGNLFIADQRCNVVWKVAPAGTMTVAAGNGTPGFSGDGGPATSASLNQPWSVAVDGKGTLYIADWGNLRVRMVKNGLIDTVAGNGLPGYTGDGGPAKSAELAGPWGIAVGAGGQIYFTDQGKFSAVIRQLTPVPAITEVDNAFSNIPNSPIQSGSWVAIKGANLSNTSPGRGWNANENFPTSMDGTSVTINGKTAFVYSISPGQVNVQAPTDSTLGPVSVVVTNNGVSSAPATATYQSNSPALLQWGGGQYPYALITNGSAFVGNPAVIPNTVSAHAGDSLTLWVTGLGPTNPPVPAGQQPATFPAIATMPAVTAGGQNVTVLGGVLRYAGLYQVNVQLPVSLPAGDLPLKIIQGSFQSPDGVLINIQ
jgi:uncharacterized protein (TIGR03437 family)